MRNRRSVPKAALVASVFRLQSNRIPRLAPGVAGGAPPAIVEMTYGGTEAAVLASKQRLVQTLFRVRIECLIELRSLLRCLAGQYNSGAL